MCRALRLGSMVELDVERIDYEGYSNRQLMTGPLVVLAIAVLVIGGFFITTGSPVTASYEFSGGTQMKIVAETDQSEIRAAFDEDISSIRPLLAEENTYIIEFVSSDSEALEQQAIAAGFEPQPQSGSTGADFAEDRQRIALLALGVSFIVMSIMIFLLFRTVVPVAAVILSAFSDIVVPIALMNVFGIQLSLGTVAALLMLIGYSVDSDILLTNHVLRRRGGFYESAYRAMRTGVTMTLTSLSAAVVLAITASAFGVPLLPAIGTVLAFGLATDLMNTYLFNLGLLRWYRGLDA